MKTTMVQGECSRDMGGIAGYEWENNESDRVISRIKRKPESAILDPSTA